MEKYKSTENSASHSTACCRQDDREVKGHEDTQVKGHEDRKVKGHEDREVSPASHQLSAEMSCLELEPEGSLTADCPPKLSRQRRTKSLYGASPSFKFGPKACIMKNQANVLTIQDPGSQRLTWYKPPLSALVIKKIWDESTISPFLDIISWLLQEQNMLVFVEAKVLDDPLLVEKSQFASLQRKLCTFQEGVDDLTDKIDLIICLGGDGTLLYASSLFQQSMPPVMAFHLGSLGFLTPHKFSEFRQRVSCVLKGDVPLTLRTRLKCVICQRDSQCPPCQVYSIKNIESKQHNLVMNEVVVDRGPHPYLCNLDLHIEHRYITSVQGDESGTLAPVI